MAYQSTVLVVDDEPDIAALLVALLESEGYQTVLASTGAEALRLVGRVKPSAVMLDLSLPDVDGLKVLRQLKQGKQSATIPVIVVSAYTGRLTAADKTLLHGVFEKPFDLDLVASAVGRICSRGAVSSVAEKTKHKVATPPAVSVA